MPTRLERITDALLQHYGERGRAISAGHAVFEVATTAERSQVVHLLCQELRVDGVEASRLVFDSPIGPPPPRYDAEQLLRKNAALDVGAICIEDYRDDDGEEVTYLTLRATHRLSTLDAGTAREMLESVALVADRLEEEIYAHDRH